MLLDHLLRTKKKYKNSKEQDIQDIFIKTKQTRPAFSITAYGKFKRLPRKAVSDKVVRDKAFHIAKNPKYDGYICGPASMVISLLLTKEQELIPI